METILGRGPGWDVPFPDQAQSLTGHLTFQAEGWHWPVLRAEGLFWPRGVSVALTDSNPLISLPAKLWTRLTGVGPVNLLGAWLALCWAAQPVAAAYAARGLRLGTLPCLVAGVLAACWPALLVRMGHVNLCGHFLILLALGLVFRRLREAGGWLAPAALLLAAVLAHPYLFQIVALVLAAIPLQAALDRRTGWRWAVAGYLAACGAAVGALLLLSGPLGGGDKGFVTFSMNLLSPIWPQRSGVFGANLPILDATGGQVEGYNWLGAGVLLLGVAALGGWVRGRPAWRPVRGLLLVLGGMALMSLSSRVYAGPVKLLDLGVKPWEDIFGTFRSPGRAFWPVGYAVMLGAVAGVARLPRPWNAVLLTAAAALQVVDAGPLRQGAREVWEHGNAIPVAPVPAATRLFGAAPHPTCAGNAAIQAEGEIMLLHAVQAGARLRNVGAGRPPPGFTCERVLSDLLELPLLPGEARAFFGEAAKAGLRPDWLGPDAICRAGPRAIVCGRDVAPFEGAPVATRTPAAPAALAADPSGPGACAAAGERMAVGRRRRAGVVGGAVQHPDAERACGDRDGADVAPGGDRRPAWRDAQRRGQRGHPGRRVEHPCPGCPAGRRSHGRRAAPAGPSGGMAAPGAERPAAIGPGPAGDDRAGASGGSEAAGRQPAGRVGGRMPAATPAAVCAGCFPVVARTAATRHTGAANSATPTPCAAPQLRSAAAGPGHNGQGARRLRQPDRFARRRPPYDGV